MKQWLAAALLLGLMACGNDAQQKQAENQSYNGSINVSADESFQPVLEQQLQVFRSSYPNIDLKVTYKPEAACLQDLQNDSVGLVFASRGLSNAEDSAFRRAKGYPMRFAKLAFDAVALVVNRASTDTQYTWKDLQSLLSGQNERQVAVDGNRATSLVRQLMDSVLAGQPLGKNIRAANGSKAVVDFVAANPGSLGFVSYGWVRELSPVSGGRAPAGVQTASLECRRCDEAGYFAQPSQRTIYNRAYPLVRPLFYLLKENSAGVGTTFVNFLSQERGQLIFRRASLLPAQMMFNKRETKL